MKEKSLAKTNKWVRRHTSGTALDRNIASSTAIETGKTVEEIGEILVKLRAERPVKLATK